MACDGRRQAKRLDQSGFPGCDWLAGIANPSSTTDPAYFTRWLSRVPGHSVELMVHPGYHDCTLIGRDCKADDEWLLRRVQELNLLRQPEFRKVVQTAGFDVVPAGRWSRKSAPIAA